MLIPIMHLLPVDVFRAYVFPVIRVEALGLLVVGPLVMVEVSDGPWLVVGACLRRISVYRLLRCAPALVDPVLDVISLSSNGVIEHLVGLVDLLKHLCCVRTTLLVEVRMVLLRKLVVG